MTVEIIKIICLVAIVFVSLLGVVAIAKIVEVMEGISAAIKEQTEYFKNDDDLDDGDEWKRLLKD